MCGVTVQVAFKLLVLDRVLEEDSVTGDAYGPYDADLVERERKRLRVEKVQPEALLRSLRPFLFFQFLVNVRRHAFIAVRRRRVPLSLGLRCSAVVLIS